MTEFGYKKLRVFKKAHDLAVRIHRMSLGLPGFEQYEEARQIRRSSKSVSALIVEGYSLRKYKKEYVHYLWRAYGSSQETVEHLELLFETGSLEDEDLYHELLGEYRDQAKMIFAFVQSVEAKHDPGFMEFHEGLAGYGEYGPNTSADARGDSEAEGVSSGSKDEHRTSNIERP